MLTSKLKRPASPLSAPVSVEGLESRQLLHGGGFGRGFHGGGRGSSLSATIAFSEAPSAVQSGLTDLASADGVSAPTSDQTVYLGNSNGVESYTLIESGTGTVTRLTVD